MAILFKEEFLKKFKAWPATFLIAQPLKQVIYLYFTQTWVRAAVVMLAKERLSQPLCPRQYLNEKGRFLQRGGMQASSISEQENYFIVEQKVSLVLSVLIFVDVDKVDIFQFWVK